jgi:hypothetical protein
MLPARLQPGAPAQAIAMTNRAERYVSSRQGHIRSSHGKDYCVKDALARCHATAHVGRERMTGSVSPQGNTRAIEVGFSRA